MAKGFYGVEYESVKGRGKQTEWYESEDEQKTAVSEMKRQGKKGVRAVRKERMDAALDAATEMFSRADAVALGSGVRVDAEPSKAYLARQAALSERLIAAGTHIRAPNGNGVILKPKEQQGSPLRSRGVLSHGGEVGKKY